MKKLMRRSVALVMMLVMILAATSTTFAATKTKTVKRRTFTTSTTAIEKRATRVYRGTNRLYVKYGEGYVKFIAPATKTYRFTFSRCTSTRKNNSNGFVEVQTRDSNPRYSFLTDVRTQGGRSNALWLSVNGKKFSGDTLSRPLATRAGLIRLKKGAVVYMYLYFGGYPTKANLVIK